MNPKIFIPSVNILRFQRKSCNQKCLLILRCVRLGHCFLLVVSGWPQKTDSGQCKMSKRKSAFPTITKNIHAILAGYSGKTD